MWQALAAILSIAYCIPAQATAAHLAEAMAWQSPSMAWAPPRSLAAAGDGVLDPATRWQPVALPAARERRTPSATPGDGTPPQVWWLRMQVPASALAPTPQGPRLYIPRWHTLGNAAVYVDGRLAWQSRGSRVLVSFNQPVWLDLGGDVRPDQPLTVHVRMASAQGAGGALSSLWAGPAEELRAGWRLRSLLQSDLLAYVRGANLVLGVLALAVWLARRRQGETGYLLFFLMSLSHVFGTSLFLVDAEGFGLDDSWFTWLTMAGSLSASTCAFLLLCRIQGRRYPRLARALLLYVATAALALLPLWSPPLGAFLPLVRLAQIPAALPLVGAAVAGAWRLRAWPHVLLAAMMVLLFPLWLHDLAMQSFRVSAEHIYATPYLYAGVIAMFLAAAFQRYQQAAREAEQARAVLAERLADQERELGRTHERLRAAERQQTLMHERQRLMREMHDGVGSSLMSALRVVQHGQAEVDVAQVLKECIDDLKISIDSLEPVDADLLALLAGLRFRLEQRLGEAGIALRWHTRDVPPLPWLDAQSALHVLRILQEVLTNIVKHSGATAITVSTAEAACGGAPGVHVCVRDDGRPFTPPTALPPGRRGLGNVRARARALDARCDWAPQAHGTVFTLWLPLQRGPARGTPATA
ncbi:ATP-binding protein [Pulveribacter sp.]|uniref:sensor histidine kinase n=1 Tax=Pulveribacter sp. TaxID=2678893 RepID=UPI0028B06B58|nr:ATP-binding protein [Pulveribacter sp.]